MTNRERALAVLTYKQYDRLPLVHFGFWRQTLEKWQEEGHITAEEAGVIRGNSSEGVKVGEKLGFDFNWQAALTTRARTDLMPGFEVKILEETEDGYIKSRNSSGVIVIEKKNTVSIPTEAGHTLVDRKSWEEEYLPRLQFSNERVNAKDREILNNMKSLEQCDIPRGIHCGSLFGKIRNWMGIEGISYLYADDPDLYAEIIDTVGNLTYNTLKDMLSTGARFDYAHFWEDICYKNGPLVMPAVFDELVGPHYKKITQLLKGNGINIVSLDCDGMIDSLIPTWFENGVNTMFPIEVGTWGANINPWREKYGKELRGVGGMDKKVFALDYAAIDTEIERLKPLIDLGGYIPCPDHRIPPDAKWENVQYYCDRLRKIFG